MPYTGHMTREFSATFSFDDGWWIGWSDDVPGASTQERTLAEARESLKEAISDIFDVRRQLGWEEPSPMLREQLTVDVA